MPGRRYYLVCYDIMEPRRWRQCYKLLHGYGERIQYSIFKCRLTEKQLAELRWKLVKVLNRDEDRLLITPIHPDDLSRIFLLNMPDITEDSQDSFVLV
ncbi:CRISPR-associated endonuclease Cas2 [Paenibacillus cisolokensis]|uniref:CRISPR-associated endonuclease Cas2 n=1 Tax=Paenibacillus TaxID=44249 RepID=UPI000720847F|nr:CRISPR-associated endonuclease Cas2 [Paenibacillus sp. 32O-W]ALS30093.1 CRISPR-associated endonuclease Cas2 [Paenibacillus sp. 32O-W]